jgi:hypothetical protein
MTQGRRNTAAQAAYDVGYGKPPVHSRFRKGQSGNPSGRPRRTNKQRAEELMLREAYRLVTVRDGHGTARIPAFQAVLRAQIALAAKGNGPAQRSVQRSLQKIEGERHALDMELLKTAIEYQAEARRIAVDRKRRGIPDDDPTMPRPEDVLINMQTQEVAICHPDFLGSGLTRDEG